MNMLDDYYKGYIVMKDIGKGIAIGLCGIGVCAVAIALKNGYCLFGFLFVALLLEIWD